MLKRLLLILAVVVAPMVPMTASAQFYPYPRDYRYYPPPPPPPPVYRERYRDYDDERPRYSRGASTLCRAVGNTVCRVRYPVPVGSYCECYTGSGSKREGQISYR